MDISWIPNIMLVRPNTSMAISQSGGRPSPSAGCISRYAAWLFEATRTVILPGLSIGLTWKVFPMIATTPRALA